MILKVGQEVMIESDLNYHPSMLAIRNTFPDVQLCLLENVGCFLLNTCTLLTQMVTSCGHFPPVAEC